MVCCVIRSWLPSLNQHGGDHSELTQVSSPLCRAWRRCQLPPPTPQRCLSTTRSSSKNFLRDKVLAANGFPLQLPRPSQRVIMLVVSGVWSHFLALWQLTSLEVAVFSTCSSRSIVFTSVDFSSENTFAKVLSPRKPLWNSYVDWQRFSNCSGCNLALSFAARMRGVSTRL